MSSQQHYPPPSYGAADAVDVAVDILQVDRPMKKMDRSETEMTVETTTETETITNYKTTSKRPMRLSVAMELLLAALQVVSVTFYLGLVEFGSTSSLFDWVHDRISRKWYALTLVILAYVVAVGGFYVMRKKPQLNWALLVVFTPLQGLFYASIDVALKSNILFLMQVYMSGLIGLMLVYETVKPWIIDLPEGAYVLDRAMDPPTEDTEEPHDVQTGNKSQKKKPQQQQKKKKKKKKTPQQPTLRKQHSKAVDTMTMSFIYMVIVGAVLMFSALAAWPLGVIFGGWFVWIVGISFLYFNMYFLLITTRAIDDDQEEAKNNVHAAIYLCITPGLGVDLLAHRIRGEEDDIEKFM